MFFWRGVTPFRRQPSSDHAVPTAAMYSVEWLSHQVIWSILLRRNITKQQDQFCKAWVYKMQQLSYNSNQNKDSMILTMQILSQQF